MNFRDPGYFRKLLAVVSPIALISFLSAATGASESIVHAGKGSSCAQAESSKAGQTRRLIVRVSDENGFPVSSAIITLTVAGGSSPVRTQTDYAGRGEFAQLEPGTYQARVEKEGFYAAVLDAFQVNEMLNVEITISHQQEIAESMNVVDSPKAIDPAQTAVSEQLGYRDILNLPYPTTRDIRAALPFIPGVLADSTGQIHVSGSETYQVFDQLDGFNITDPISGKFEMRVSVDALRSVEVQSGRYSVEHGKGSGGLLSLASGMGDNHFRFSATNFIPSIQNRRGLSLNDWTPRATFSGPLRKDKAWFFESADAEYKLNVVRELPVGADRNSSWRMSSLTRGQVNLSQTNILTAGVLINRQHAANAGLSRFDPIETTRDEKGSAFLIAVKDEMFFSNGVLLNVGLGVSQFRSSEHPQGALPYVVRPEGTSGNFYMSADRVSRRIQTLVDATLPGAEWRGRHEIKLGTDIERVTSDQLLNRRDILILREDGTLSRRVSFSNQPRFDKDNLQLGCYVQDRWSLSERLMLEAGLRADRDQIVQRVALSPRLSATYLLTGDGTTKLSAGVGVFRDQTNLDFITRPLGGTRSDFFYGADGQILEKPAVETAFQVDDRDLRVPRTLNWSVGVERRLPFSIYASAQFIQKRGRNGFVFENAPSPADAMIDVFVLRNGRGDRYDSVEINARRTFKSSYSVFASYSRSAARSNQVLDFSLDHLLFSSQMGGPLGWDSPNRFLSWGWLPLVKGFDFAYSMDWRDGYPFSVVDQDQDLVGEPGARRFPAYFSLNLHVERRFKLFGAQWALRAGFNNVTSRDNPSGVNNNVDSPQFLTFGGLQHRVFTGRIRFLGRK